MSIGPEADGSRMSGWQMILVLSLMLGAVLASGQVPAVHGQMLPQNNTSTGEPGAAPATSHTVSPDFFGLTVLDFRNKQPLLPFGITRTWDAYPGLDWAEANPAAGKFVFGPLDEYLRLYGREGREIIYTFGRTPSWASTRPEAAGAYSPGECAAPTLAAWDDYVAAVVKHAGGRIRYWELWNEPDQPRFYCGDIPAMVAMAQRAYATIKRIDPSAIVLSPATTGGTGAGWLAQFMAAGGKGTFDAVAFHGYEGTQAEAILPIVAVYRHALRSLRMPDLPLFDTECSWGDNPIGDDAHRAAFLSKYFLLQWSANVSRVLWYAYDGSPGWGRLIDDAGKLLPDGVAYAETRKWIVGATLTKPCAQDTDGTWTCGIARKGGYVGQILWNSRAPAQVSVAVPSGSTDYRTLEGTTNPIRNGVVPVGMMPVLVESRQGVR